MTVSLLNTTLFPISKGRDTKKTETGVLEVNFFHMGRETLKNRNFNSLRVVLW